MKKNTQIRAVKRAIAIIGGPAEAARRIDALATSRFAATRLRVRSGETVRQWIRSQVPAEWCPILETLTGVRCEELRPDVAWHVLRSAPKGSGVPHADGV